MRIHHHRASGAAPDDPLPEQPVVVSLSSIASRVYPAPVVNNGVLIGCAAVRRLPGEGIHPVICRASNECGVVVGCEFTIRVLPARATPSSSAP
jgi:hypothetical protein